MYATVARSRTCAAAQTPPSETDTRKVEKEVLEKVSNVFRRKTFCSRLPTLNALWFLRPVFKLKDCGDKSLAGLMHTHTHTYQTGNRVNVPGPFGFCFAFSKSHCPNRRIQLKPTKTIKTNDKPMVNGTCRLKNDPYAFVAVVRAATYNRRYNVSGSVFTVCTC